MNKTKIPYADHTCNPITADWIADVQDYSKLTERLKAFYEAMKEKNE